MAKRAATAFPCVRHPDRRRCARPPITSGRRSARVMAKASSAKVWAGAAARSRLFRSLHRFLSVREETPTPGNIRPGPILSTKGPTGNLFSKSQAKRVRGILEARRRKNSRAPGSSRIVSPEAANSQKRCSHSSGISRRSIREKFETDILSLIQARKQKSSGSPKQDREDHFSRTIRKNSISGFFPGFL